MFWISNFKTNKINGCPQKPLLFMSVLFLSLLTLFGVSCGLSSEQNATHQAERTQLKTVYDEQLQISLVSKSSRAGENRFYFEICTFNWKQEGSASENCTHAFQIENQQPFEFTILNPSNQEKEQAGHNAPHSTQSQEHFFQSPNINIQISPISLLEDLTADQDNQATSDRNSSSSSRSIPQIDPSLVAPQWFPNKTLSLWDNELNLQHFYAHHQVESATKYLNELGSYLNHHSAKDTKNGLIQEFCLPLLSTCEPLSPMALNDVTQLVTGYESSLKQATEERVELLLLLKLLGCEINTSSQRLRSYLVCQNTDFSTEQSASLLQSKMSVFKYADLAGSSFEGATISKKDFSFSQINQGVFTDAIGSQSNFYHAQLSEADFQMAHLFHTNFEHASLRFAQLQHAHIRDTSFKNSHLYGATLDSISLWGTVDFEGADLREASFDHVVFGSYTNKNRIIFKNADASGASFRQTRFRAAEACDFSGVNLKGADFQEAHLDQCNFKGADLRGANFTSAVIESSDFKDALTEGVTWNNTDMDCSSYNSLDHPPTRNFLQSLDRVFSGECY